MAVTIEVHLPDGSVRDVPEGSDAGWLASAIGPRLAAAAVAATVDGRPVDLSTPLPGGSTVAVVTPNTPLGRDVIRHSTAHVLAQAVLRLWPGARYAIGPVIDDGFYYDFELPDGARFTDDDLARVEAEMRQVMAEDQPFVREEHRADDALRIFADQPYKREIIEAVAGGSVEVDAAPAVSGEPGRGDSPVLSTYRNSPSFVDLCLGPHVPSTGRLGHFKLMRVAGAYWRGDEKRPQLQRIYGTAWESDQALADHLHRLAEAERRDHRRLGAELDLFSFPDEIGSGLAVFHPKGGTVRRLMEDYSRERHVAAGYDFVGSPHITKAELFETSGHLDWFAEGMYPPMRLDGTQEYYLKPMNCPFHMLIYRSRQRSYRELPLRLFEFGTVYRYEKSGVVHGLTRTRGFTQDDAHIFCTPEQMEAELASLLTFVLDVLGDYGLNDFFLEISTRPEHKAVGSEEEWESATSVLRRVGEARGLEMVLDEGGGAFYGPKISVQARDAIGRSWQLSTIQLDFQEPVLFGLEYTDPANERRRPVMIHRALFGSVERFFAILVEHYAGAFPTWLAPEQVRVLPVRDDHMDYATAVTNQIGAAGYRVSAESAAEPLGTRIRKAKLAMVPYVLVVGDDDVAASTVGVNRRGSERPERGVPVSELMERLADDVSAKRS
ncbi:MAG: threonine--tRNA ligase [Acidimicrobiales bacterium]